jgi:hypothetical protein
MRLIRRNAMVSYRNCLAETSAAPCSGGALATESKLKVLPSERSVSDVAFLFGEPDGTSQSIRDGNKKKRAPAPKRRSSASKCSGDVQQICRARSASCRMARLAVNRSLSLRVLESTS